MLIFRFAFTGPEPEVLSAALHDYARRRLPAATRLLYLERDYGLIIKGTRLKLLNAEYDVPSVRKPVAMEVATSIVSEIVTRDVRQGQGPTTVQRLAALQHNALLPRSMVREVMQAIAPGGADIRRPGKRRALKPRGALNGIGIFQEIHADGHEKLSEKALKMGAGIGIDVYGMRDHIGKVLMMKVVPNARCSTTVGHLYLDMVEELGIIPIQMTVDGGSEVGWMHSAQTTLRYVYMPELSPDAWKPMVSLPSTSNVSIEATWWFERRFDGLSLRDILEQGRAHLRTGDEIHQQLFRWLWPKIVQNSLDLFMDYFNNNKTKKQKGKLLPSGVAPNVVYDFPKEYGLENVGQPVDIAAIQILRAEIPVSRTESYRWVTDEFDAIAQAVYDALLDRSMAAIDGWRVFNQMAPIVRRLCMQDHL
ncbi:hypothetical protein C8J56DRAFT_785419 [Mycena floridula]|nr:hypothetical protein C8J56DRAFT_785419 [Mycena floridula]